MNRSPFRFPLWVERLEDRDATNSLLAIDDVLNGPLPSEAAAPPPANISLLGGSATFSGQLGQPTPRADSADSPNEPNRVPASEPVTGETPSHPLDSPLDSAGALKDPLFMISSDMFEQSESTGSDSFTAASNSNGAGAGSAVAGLSEPGPASQRPATEAPASPATDAPASPATDAPASPNPTTENQPAPITPDDADGVSAETEAMGPNHGDGNHDGIRDAIQSDVTSLRASSGGSFVTVDAMGHTLTNVRAIAAPSANAGNVNLPMGMFQFEVRGVTPGGAATVLLTLPDGSNPHHYFKQDSTGALQSFDFDGTTGAEFNGNVVTLHFVDGGRGDADGAANGVVVDPGGYGSYPIVTAAKVREVTFSGDDRINIVADPGTPDYPTGAQWVDTDLNGIIDAPGDRALPVGYPRNKNALVSARFAATISDWPYPPSIYSLKVKCTNPLTAYSPYYFSIPWTTVTLDGTDLVLPPTPVDNPFPTFVNYGTIQLNWEFSNSGGLGTSPAGVSANELYVTLATPSTSPVYHTLIHTSVPISAMFPAGVESRVISQTWMNFEARQLMTRNVNPLYNGLELRYYGEWDTPSQTAATLLQNLDGQCYAFAELFVKSLKAAGVNDTPLVFTKVGSIANEALLTKNWLFSGDGTVNVTFNNRVYRYQNTLADPTQNPSNNGGFGVYMKKTNGVWGYYWGTTVEVADDTTGVPGQNSVNPKSTFGDHTIVKISDKYYDPSYGTGPFDTLQAWEDASVPGFMTVDNQGANNNYRLVFRKNLAGPDIEPKP